MSEDLRDAARHHLHVPVYIRYGRRPFLGACARDLSAGGMFLSVQSLTLPAGTPIELELSCRGRNWIIPAVVTHGDNTGIGVIFREPQVELYHDLMRAEGMRPPITTTTRSGADSRP
ncbi:PilZ domain-containing protein [uncultured Thiohalocapsa sp.]|uniref:PilZ domain-containing protein n=1 Tax=uncultured Thiohalocapsa sp. TaxID=768990 RepID=UPI0025DB2C0E|nr:PilZ domain-containing protein [uncultured Thiohalocapsa sp.]